MQSSSSTFFRCGAWRVSVASGCVAASLLAGCAHEAGKAPLPTSGNACNAQAALDVVKNQKPTAAIQQQALRLSGAKTMRTFHKSDMVTQDFVPDRLNLITNDAGVIEAANCG